MKTTTTEPKMKKNIQKSKAKKSPRPPKVKKNTKPPALFKKKYTEKKFKNKILKKLYIPADKTFIESLFDVYTDPKKGTCHSFKKDLTLSKLEVKRVGRIAKQIKKQKGRFNFASIGAALVVLAILILSLTLFRNPIARFALEKSLEGVFGAKVDISLVDVNFLDARFTIGGLQVTNKKAPMKNIFGLDKMELYFDLLELSRGKLVSNNIEITGVTWNTARTVSGAFSPKKQKKIDTAEKKKKTQPASSKPNPVSIAIGAEVHKLKSGISIDAGIGAIKDQLDPIAFFETEKKALLTPAIAERLSVDVPILLDDWQTKSSEIRETVDSVVKDGSKLVTLDVRSIKTVEEVRTALEDITGALKTVENARSTVKSFAQDASDDVKMITALSREAEDAIKGDVNRITNLANSVISFDLADGGNLISGLFETLVINTLGTYYPYLEKGLSLLENAQASTKKTKKPKLKAKSSVVSRLSGRDFSFGSNSVPSLLFKNIHISALDTLSAFSAEARVQNITNDADMLGLPILFVGNAGVKALGFGLDGNVDLRFGATEVVATNVTGSGFPIAIGNSSSSEIVGVPSIRGSLEVAGNVSILSDESLHISGKGTIYDASITVQPFEPSIVFSAYSGVFSRINTVEAGLTAHITPQAGVKMDLVTDLDTVLASALKDEAAVQIEKFKAEVITVGTAYLEEQKKVYASEIERVTEVLTRVNAVVKEFENYEDTFENKKKELENRVNSIITEKSDAVKKAAQEAGQKAAQEAREAAENAAQEAAKKAAAELMKKIPKF